jgi:hypothetical protein
VSSVCFRQEVLEVLEMLEVICCALEAVEGQLRCGRCWRCSSGKVVPVLLAVEAGDVLPSRRVLSKPRAISPCAVDAVCRQRCGAINVCAVNVRAINVCAIKPCAVNAVCCQRVCRRSCVPSKLCAIKAVCHQSCVPSKLCSVKVGVTLEVAARSGGSSKAWR